MGSDDRARAEDLGGAEDRADVVRVGDPVEEQHRRGEPARGADLGDRAPVERLDFERGALVHRLRVEERREAAGVDDLRGEAAGGDGVAEAFGGVEGDDQPVPHPRRIAQRVADGMDAEEPEGPRPAPRPLALPLDRPGRLLAHAPPPCPDPCPGRPDRMCRAATQPSTERCAAAATANSIEARPRVQPESRASAWSISATRLRTISSESLRSRPRRK